MATYTKTELSLSTQGRPIKVVATSIGSGTPIHTTGTSATTRDEIWLWAWNTDTSARVLTIGFGGTTDPDDLIEVTINPNTSDPKLVIPGIPLRGNGSAGLTVSAAGSAANVIVVFGYVNRITS